MLWEDKFDFFSLIGSLLWMFLVENLPEVENSLLFFTLI